MATPANPAVISTRTLMAASTRCHSKGRAAADPSKIRPNTRGSVGFRPFGARIPSHDPCKSVHESAKGRDRDAPAAGGFGELGAETGPDAGHRAYPSLGGGGGIVGDQQDRK